MLGLQVPIYDSLARAGLGLGADVTYAEFYDAFMESYGRSREGYKVAAKAILGDLVGDEARERLGRGLPDEWFMMRGHDSMLWKAGKKKNKTKKGKGKERKERKERGGTSKK